MKSSLLIAIRFYDGRYHGVGDWPPSPGRLFQALLAGAARGQQLHHEDKQALLWLENQRAPVIAAPAAHQGQTITNYVPNNDLDTVDGDPAKTAKLRTAKEQRPYLFDMSSPIFFMWHFDNHIENHQYVERLCKIAHQLYQLGRGIDMAWSHAQQLTAQRAYQQLAGYPGHVHHPHEHGHGRVYLSCPHAGTLSSLIERHSLILARFSPFQKVRSFSQPAKANFKKVYYHAITHRLLFEIREMTIERAYISYPTEQAVQLVKLIRDQASAHLSKSLMEQKSEVEAVFIGRGAQEIHKSRRIKIIPIPSIGHPHADYGIRRLIVEVPAQTPLLKEDIRWAFLQVQADFCGKQWHLVPSMEMQMLSHYGIAMSSRYNKGFTSWYTVTPIVLSYIKRQKRALASARIDEHQQVAGLVKAALRHAGVVAEPISIDLTRDPCEVKGLPAKEFSQSSRFSVHNLYHARITFNKKVSGPLTLGHGRYLGLGLMAPAKQQYPVADVWCFAIPGGTNISVQDSGALVRSMRRALMSLAKNKYGKVPRLFSGHNYDGTPSNSGQHEHVFIATIDDTQDGWINRVMVAAPWSCDRRVRPKGYDQAQFSRVVKRLKTLKAGKLGVLHFQHGALLGEDDHVMKYSTWWQSCTFFQPTRYPHRSQDPQLFVMSDITAECGRRGLPKPDVKLLDMKIGPKGGNIKALMRLRFPAPVQGPLLLGRGSHLGAGLFCAVN